MRKTSKKKSMHSHCMNNNNVHIHYTEVVNWEQIYSINCYNSSRQNNYKIIHSRNKQSLWA